MDFFIRSVHRISIFCGTVATALLCLAILVIIDMVVERYVFNLSTSWQTEFVIYSLAGGTFIGCPYVLLKKGHVNVIVYSRDPSLALTTLCFTPGHWHT